MTPVAPSSDEGNPRRGPLFGKVFRLFSVGGGARGAVFQTLPTKKEEILPVISRREGFLTPGTC